MSPSTHTKSMLERTADLNDLVSENATLKEEQAVLKAELRKLKEGAKSLRPYSNITTAAFVEKMQPHSAKTSPRLTSAQSAADLFQKEDSHHESKLQNYIQRLLEEQEKLAQENSKLRNKGQEFQAEALALREDLKRERKKGEETQRAMLKKVRRINDEHELQIKRLKARLTEAFEKKARDFVTERREWESERASYLRQLEINSKHEEISEAMEHLSMILVSKREQDLLTEQQKSLVRNLFGEHSFQNRPITSAADKKRSKQQQCNAMSIEIRELLQEYLRDLDVLEGIREGIEAGCEGIDLALMQAKMMGEDAVSLGNKKERVLSQLEDVLEGDISIEGEVDREKLKYVIFDV